MGVTSQHPLFVAGEGWIVAGELVPGDVVRDSALQSLRVLSVELDSTPTRVHNLEVAGAHTYFAGELEAWGHNARAPTKATKSAAKACATNANGVLQCEYCGVPLTEKYGFPNSLEFDHADPYSRGFGRGLENIICSCRTCNRQKGARSFADWLQDRFGLL